MATGAATGYHWPMRVALPRQSRLVKRVLPRSLLALFPNADRRNETSAVDVATAIEDLDARVPGLRDRLVESGPRLRPHIKVFVAGLPADLDTPIGPTDTVHVIPAVSGG